jgi:hypothetical protein
VIVVVLEYSVEPLAGVKVHPLCALSCPADDTNAKAAVRAGTSRLNLRQENLRGNREAAPDDMGGDLAF